MRASMSFCLRSRFRISRFARSNCSRVTAAAGSAPPPPAVPRLAASARRASRRWMRDLRLSTSGCASVYRALRAASWRVSSASSTETEEPAPPDDPPRPRASVSCFSRAKSRFSSTICASRWSICMVARFASSCEGSRPMCCSLKRRSAASLLSSSVARLVQLGEEEVHRPLHLLLAGLDRLLDEEAGQPVGDLLRGARIVVEERDGEAVVAGERDGDALPHQLHAAGPGEVRVGLGLLQHALQAGAAQDLGLDRLQPLARVPGGHLGDERLGDLLGLHQHQGRGEVLAGQEPEGGHREEEHPQPRHDDHEGPAQRGVQEVADLAPAEGVRVVGVAGARGRTAVRRTARAHGTMIVSPGASRTFWPTSFPSATRR